MRRYVPVAVLVLVVMFVALLAVSSSAAKPPPAPPPQLSFGETSPYSLGTVDEGANFSSLSLSFMGKGSSGRISFSLAMAEGSAGFSITDDQCSGTNLSAKHSSCDFTVRYAWNGPVGSDSATLTATGSKGLTTSLDLTGESVNSPPTVTGQEVTVDENTAKTITLEGGDPNGEPVTFSIVDQPNHGSLGSVGTASCSGTPSVCTADVTYTPNSDYQGSDFFTFTTNDGTVDSDWVAYVSITVGTVAPACTAGSEDFSGFADGAQPTTFAGGTIDTAYGAASGTHVAGGILIAGVDWGGEEGFTAGTHVLYTGAGVDSFQLSFTGPVGSVQLQAQSSSGWYETTETLTAYDASDNVIDTDSATSSFLVNTLTVSSTSNDIDHFTIATDDANEQGLAFTNLSWNCAS